MSLRSRISGFGNAVADSKALSESKKAGKSAGTAIADGCGFCAFLAAKLVRPLTSRVSSSYKAYKQSVAQEY